MRVNHVGEVCAQALYTAQAMVTQDAHLRARLLEAAQEEMDHLAWTHARFSDADPVGAHIPNSIDKVASIVVTARDLGPWTASLQWRYLGSGPLIEDNSVRARSALTTNLRINHQFNPRTSLTLDVFNLFDRRVNDIEYFYESRLPGELAAVADKHVHPAEPRTVRLTLAHNF